MSMTDDRPKKSWKEIDAARDRSGGVRKRRDPDETSRQKVEHSQAYSKYKANLDKLFTPGGSALPESMREKLGPTTPEAKAQRAALDALKATPNDETLKACLDAGATLPDEPRLLLSLFDVKDESLLPPVLERLLEIVEGGKKPNRMLLLQKLDALKNKTADDRVLSLAEDLRGALE
jgi:hypothetical protein